jgi:hypothetical protein
MCRRFGVRSRAARSFERSVDERDRAAASGTSDDVHWHHSRIRFYVLLEIEIVVDLLRYVTRKQIRNSSVVL